MEIGEILHFLGDIYEHRMPFDRLLGIRIAALTLEEVKVQIDMREELVGNYIRGILHGGVISSVLDLTGGLVASVELIKHLQNAGLEELATKLTRIGTIDLRVDYLRAGKGEHFIATGSVLRKGNKVAVVRTEMVNDKNILIAAGTGTYLIG